MSTPTPDSLAESCLREVALTQGGPLSEPALARVTDIFRACLRSNRARDAVMELLVLSFFLEKRRGAIEPARQLICLAETATSLLLQLGETVESLFASRQLKKRLEFLGLAPRQDTNGSSEAEGISLLELRSRY